MIELSRPGGDLACRPRQRNVLADDLRGRADRLEAEAAVKSQREAEVEKALKAWHHVGAESLAENSDELERECMRAALDAVRGDSGE